ncbi:MAG TPA: hypothetical protein VIY51_10840 [Xanthobacteraceae bacterium]
MSDMLTHWAAFEDCCRLGQLDERIESVFRAALVQQREAGRLGTLTRLGAKWMQPMLEGVRDKWSASSRDPKLQRNLGFVLGGLIHQATDNVMKPPLSRAASGTWSQMQAYLRGTPGTPPVSPQVVEAAHEYSAYLDAEVFRQVYLDGGADPFSEFFMAKLSPKGEAFEEFVRALFQRSLLSVHTLNPTVDHMEDWLENLFRTVQPSFVGIDRWVRVYNQPDPQKIEAFGVRTSFYRPDDPPIRVARALQRGEPVDAAARQAVFAEGTHACYYGHILQTGLDYLRKASQFWRGESGHLVAPNFDEWPLS